MASVLRIAVGMLLSARLLTSVVSSCILVIDVDEVYILSSMYVNHGNVVEDDEALLRNDVVQATMKGPTRTPQGETIQPTHKSFSGEYAVVLSFDLHQKVKNIRIFGDSIAIFRQFGMPPR